MTGCSATGHPGGIARVCAVCRWRALPDDRPQVCPLCERRMDRQLDLLGRVARVLEVVARTEPTARGELDLGVLDLTLPGNPAIVLGELEDQIGDVPIAARLGSWAEDWSGRDVWSVGAPAAAAWLRRGLAWACRQHPGITDFAGELRETYAAARRALDRDLRPTRYTAPCRACGANALMRFPGAWIECSPRQGGCGRLWDTPDVVDDEAVLRVEDWLWWRSTVDPWEQLDSKHAAMYAGRPVGTIWAWASRGLLQPIRPVPQVAGKLAPRYWALEVDRCAARLEDAARGRAQRRSGGHVPSAQSPTC